MAWTLLIIFLFFFCKNEMVNEYERHFFNVGKPKTKNWELECNNFDFDVEMKNFYETKMKKRDFWKSLFVFCISKAKGVVGCLCNLSKKIYIEILHGNI